ncbi:hypothetical protein DCS_06389 [Drechmeria coniospora]|uniref:Uncharacterized protein n=1 Tax=Drechmeria coniospora TaxID=98403 RepID=A0A151GBK7_DRECN|nr:hypothetical protein DCS_06389 [Drechmeria coniospora]KYK54431.1 hypothetical protein DCS_06389 [Drechmeria coniospora]
MINENKALLRQLFEDVALDRQGELEFRCRLVHGAMVEIPITLDATFNEVESRSNKFLRGRKRVVPGRISAKSWSRSKSRRGENPDELFSGLGDRAATERTARCAGSCSLANDLMEEQQHALRAVVLVATGLVFARLVGCRSEVETCFVNWFLVADMLGLGR